MDLQDIIQQIEVWEPWVENYKTMVPKFIEEASQNKDWSEWDKDTFDVYFNQLEGNPISSMKQGYFTLEQRDLIKSHWRDFSKDLQDIALSQTVPLFDKYEAITNKINSLYDGNRYASINRMIAGLQPQLLCTIVNGMHLNTFCYYLETYCEGKCKFEGDYFHKSHQICTLFNSLQPHRSYYENVTLPWQTYEFIRDYLQKNSQNKESMNNLKNLILSNHNIILSGAPGTGKTYLAKQIAAQMILEKEYNEKTVSYDEKKKMEEQCEFVQFHPSYDYTDFVEGLRPISDKNGNVGFERRDGVFMAFCRKALDAYIKTEDKKSAPKYVFIIDEINRGEISKIFGELFFSIDPGYRGPEGVVTTQYSNLWKETDYYDGGKKFYVPENVYIIGTMNDIDRSVESMDFAFRRRFAFKEVTAEESQQMLDSDSAWGKDEKGNSRKPSDGVISDIKERMDKLNEAICPDKKDSNKKGIEGLSSAYHIGASYFLKLANYKNGEDSYDYEKLWDYHLKGLLFEYLRGMPDAKDKLDALGEAFGIKTSDSNPS